MIKKIKIVFILSQHFHCIFSKEMVSCDQSTAFFAVDLLIEYVSFHCVQIPMVFSLQLFTVCE